MREHQGGEEFAIVVRALPDGVPPVIRLRHVLKGLLRQHAFRAVSVRETTPALPPQRRPEGNAAAAG